MVGKSVTCARIAITKTPLRSNPVVPGELSRIVTSKRRMGVNRETRTIGITVKNRILITGIILAIAVLWFTDNIRLQLRGK
jgi:hypothetical protein